MNPLASRRHLLVAESELNRALLVEDTGTLTAEVNALVNRTKSLGSLASSAAVLVAGLAAFRRGPSGPTDAKPSWLQTILKGAGLISTLWLAFRSPDRVQKDK